jgi:hypothetical protein
MVHRIVVAGYQRAHAAEVAAALEVFSAADFYLYLVEGRTVTRRSRSS